VPDRVRTHTRAKPGGGTTTVRNHNRGSRPRAKKKALISPRHAWGLGKKAFRANQKKKRAVAGLLGLLALTEMVAWLALQGVSLVLVTAGVLALSAGVVGAAAGGVHRGSRR